MREQTNLWLGEKSAFDHWSDKPLLLVKSLPANGNMIRWSGDNCPSCGTHHSRDDLRLCVEKTLNNEVTTAAAE